MFRFNCKVFGNLPDIEKLPTEANLPRIAFDRIVYVNLPDIKNIPKDPNWPDNFIHANLSDLLNKINSTGSFRHYYFNFPSIAEIPIVKKHRGQHRDDETIHNDPLLHEFSARY